MPADASPLPGVKMILLQELESMEAFTTGTGPQRLYPSLMGCQG